MDDEVLSSLDTRAYRLRRQATGQHRCVWNEAVAEGHFDIPNSTAAWQDAFRRAFDDCLGGLRDWEKVPLNPRVYDKTQCDGYTRETVVFSTREGLDAIGFLLIPDNCPPDQPTVLCIPGHGVGITGLTGLVPEDYSFTFGIQSVKRGYPTFCVEMLGFGFRRDAQARAAGLHNSSCTREAMAALMLGETIGGWRVWDAMRALDYLETRPEVDSERLAIMGISGGGLVSLFTAALDTRIKASVVSGYFNTFEASILGMDHCVDNYAPGLLALCEMPTLAALIAPRALWVENGTDDPIFPLAAFHTAVAEATSIYNTFGVPEKFGSEVFTGRHMFHGVGAFAFLERQFNVG